MGAPRLPLLMLPGLDGSGGLFAPLLAAGPRAFDPVVVPLPSVEPLGYDQYLEQVRRMAPATGAWALLAESFSGPLAVRWAAERPRGLRALILVSTFLHRPLQPWLAPLSPLVGRALFSLPLPASAVRLLLSGWAAPGALVRRVQELTGAVPASVLARRSREALRADVRRALASTEVPVLYLGPTGDRLIRTDVADDVRAARPDAEVARLDGPHMLLQVRPEPCLGRIEGFLAGLR